MRLKERLAFLEDLLGVPGPNRAYNLHLFVFEFNGTLLTSNLPRMLFSVVNVSLDEEI